MRIRKLWMFLILSISLTIWSGCGSEGDSGNLSGDGESESTEQNENAGGDTDNEEQNEDEGFPACDPEASAQTLSIVHVNDLHSAYTPGELSDDDPFARIVGYYRQVKAENPYTLFTNGGDDHEKGSVAEPLSGGYSTIEITKAMPFDVRVIGNHDFAWGEEELVDFANDSSALVVASNTTYTGSLDWKALEYAEMEVGCIKVGYFGMVGQPWNENNRQYSGPYMDHFETDFSYVERATEIVEAHRDDVDLMVMVSHLGDEWDRIISIAVPGIDLVLGGHSHSQLTDTATDSDTLIVRTQASGVRISRLDLTVDLSTREITDHELTITMNLPGVVEPDGETAKIVADVMARYAPDANKDIAWAENSVSESGMARIAAEAAIAHWDCDAALMKIDTAWINGWGAGALTQQEIYNAYKIEKQPAGTPSWNAMYKLNITGENLLTLMGSYDSGKWVLVVPEGDIDYDRVYTLGIQKGPAHHPDEHLPAGIETSRPEVWEGREMYDLLETYGRARAANCRYIDSDSTLSDCSPAR